MNLHRAKKIVLLGMMSRKPVASIIWQTVHYLVGFQRLGYDVYYVEAHGGAPLPFTQSDGDDGSARAAAFIDGVMRRFDLGGRWAYHALHGDGRCFGLSESQLKKLYRSATLLINLHGCTRPLPEHSATGRLVYLETDPGAVQIKLHHNVQEIADLLEPHCAFFTFGENYGRPDCKLPVSKGFDFRPTRQPVVVDVWRSFGNGTGRAFSTVGSWRQHGREVEFRGEVYRWSKRGEFEKFLDLPLYTNQTFELALNRYSETDKRSLEEKGWRVLDALAFSNDPDAYRRYIAQSRGEFTVAKDQNVRLRSGWFSDRSATYLAAGRPVITQETGFSNSLPTGRGLFAFSTMEEIAQALEIIDSDYEHHRRAAAAVAQEYFNFDVVLSPLLADLGLSDSASGLRKVTEIDEDFTDRELADPEGYVNEPCSPFSPSMVLTPTSRRPTTLSEATVKAVLAADCLPILPARYDVISFPGHNRSSDPQKSQWIIDLFANQGYRVFSIELDARSSSEASQAFRLRAIAPNLFEARLRVARQPGIYSLKSKPGGAILLEALEALRSTYCIDAAVVDVQPPYWVPVAMHARERWGWKVVYERPSEPEVYPTIDRSSMQEADVVVGPEATLLGRGSGSASARGSQSGQSDCAEVWQRLEKSIRAVFKRASIVIVTFNNLLYTKLCLRSLLANTEYPNYEVVVVDNGSSDGTPAYLRSLMRQHPHVRAVFNVDNLGYASANNQGLAVATGDVLVLLNNDTLVPRGWLTRLARHLEDPDIGLIGPVTNRIGNEAQVDVSYHTYGEFVQFARCYSRTHEGQIFDTRTLMMFCVAMRRDVYERVGALDERYEVGTFEDDDYAIRVRSVGHRVARAEDVFVHHFGEATFGKLVPTGEYGRLLRANRRRFEEKWGIRWEPHRHRPNDGYDGLVGRIRQLVGDALPAGSTVAVVSKGDDELLRLDGRWGWHFPQGEDGLYAGHYPADDGEAIAHLESLRAGGAEFLLLPAPAFWWLEHYGGFGRHLKERYGRIWSDADCAIYELSFTEPNGVETWAAEVVGSVDARVGHPRLPPGTERPRGSHEHLGGAN